MKYSDLKKHMIVQLVDNNSDFTEPPVNVIVLEVTEKDIRQGCNAMTPGLYGFRGLWYRGNGTTRKSYGKIYNLSNYEDNEITLVRKDIWKLSKNDLMKILK